MNVQSIPVGPFGSNCHIIHNERREALVIDPGADGPVIIDYIQQEKLQVAVYLLTHGHVDHVSALAEVHRAFPAPIALHPRDATWAFSPMNQVLPYFSIPEAPPSIDRDLDDAQEYEDAGFKYRTIFSPGHAPGHIVFYLPSEKALFSGDALFKGSVGRVDLPGGNPQELEHSLSRLMDLPDDTIVYPGHGPNTTIGEERKTNPFLRPGALG